MLMKNNYARTEKNIDKKLKIILSELQRNLLLKYVILYILDMDTERAISSAISNNSKYHVYLTHGELESMIRNISFLANHEEKNKNLILELDELADYLECILNECE